ncbi:MAG: phosphoglycerate dehydrogenase, partial [Chloroflexi bacterium]|nr:phosphoglycerate dehydrogenase [Chloroflexota bacterium]
MTQKTVATTSAVFPAPLDLLERHLGAFGPVVPYDMEHRPFTPGEADAFLAVAHDATAIYLQPGFITAEIIRGMPRLRIVAVHGVGVEYVDLAAARAAGVWVTNAPGGSANAVAEHAVGLMLAIARGIARADAALRATGDWERSRVRGFDLRGKTLGLVGFGHIAQRVATIARGFGIAVLAWGRHVEERAPVFGARPAALDDLLAAADVVSIHLPGTAETAGLIG